MTDHPITPPPELIKDWYDEWNESDQTTHFAHTHIAIRAAQWGADQELDACCELLKQKGVPAWSLLRSHRRPKPPSLKKQALEALEDAGRKLPIGFYDQYGVIRRALEALPDD